MDTHPHNQPTSDIDSPHQGVVIEDYRGPLLSQLPRRSGGSTSLTSTYSASVFADSPLPEWLAEQPQPRQPTRLRRWLTGMLYSDDAVLNSAKHGVGWMLLALLGFGLTIGMIVLNPQFGQFMLVGDLMVCVGPLLILTFLTAALANSIGSLRTAHRSHQPSLVRKLSVVSLSIELIMSAVAIVVIISSVASFIHLIDCNNCGL